MKTLRQLLFGVFLTLISLILVLGSFVIALAEGGQPVARATAAATLTPLLPPLAPGSTTTVPSELPSPTSADASEASPAPSDTPLPTSASCTYPSGWISITINAGDTLESLAQLYETSDDALREGNCLLSDTLRAGTLLFVPDVLPTATRTPTPQPAEQCGPPSDWVLYTVKSGENLFRISLAYGVSVAQLQFANCLGSSTTIVAGEQIYVPNVPTRTPSRTPTPTETEEPDPTDTQPPATSTPTPSPTDTSAPADTATPTNTATATATDTPTPSSTPTPTSTPTATATDTPTATNTP